MEPPAGAIVKCWGQGHETERQSPWRELIVECGTDTSKWRAGSCLGVLWLKELTGQEGGPVKACSASWHSSMRRRELLGGGEEKEKNAPWESTKPRPGPKEITSEAGSTKPKKKKAFLF